MKPNGDSMTIEGRKWCESKRFFNMHGQPIRTLKKYK